MKYINTINSQFSDYKYNGGSSACFIKCPAFSKILNIQIKNSMLNIIYQSNEYVNIYENNGEFKTFTFIVISGLIQNNTTIPDSFEYFDTIKTLEDDRVEYYHIFIQETKSLKEIRDNKIDELMNSEF